MPNKHFVIILAGGEGKRMQTDTLKQFLVLGKKPVLMHSLHTFYQFDKKSVLSVVLPKNKINYWKSICKKYDFNLQHNIFFGGKSRYDSVKNALFKLDINQDDIVSIHDGVRPFISKELIKKIFNSALKKGHAAPILAPKDSLRMFIENSTRTKSVDRSIFRLTQTPQIFKGDIIKIAYQKANNNNTDDISLIENDVSKVNLINGEQINIKITTKEDWYLAQKIIKP
tara:strand:+ start:245 stop:925 length:681 start_codon:yes stop_codon:yes gene_type:complete